MTVMICCGVTPCLGVSMTSTSVVLGIAALGTPEAPPDCDWATDDAEITEFIGLSFLDSAWFDQSKKSTNRTLFVVVPPGTNNSLRRGSLSMVTNKFSWHAEPCGTLGYHYSFAVVR